MRRVEDIYNEYVRGLSVSERLELLVLVARDPATQAEPPAESQLRVTVQERLTSPERLSLLGKEYPA